MLQIDLTEKQNEYLIELIEGTISDLRMEIAHTDSPFYKDKLRNRKDDLGAILEKLKELRNEDK